MKRKSNRTSGIAQETAMNKTLLSTGLIAAALSLVPGESQACGATLFGTGQGTRFQAYRARVPANVLIYASDQLADSSATTEPGIKDGLEKAGHKITVVSSADALSAELKAKHYDVVIAGAGDADTVADQLDARAGKGTGIVPIVSKTSAASLSPERYPTSLRTGAGIGQFLKAINSVMALKVK